MKQLREAWDRARPLVKSKARAVVSAVGVYLDDLLLLSAGACLVSAAGDLGGRPAALITAGVWCTVYAVVVARARGGRK